MAGFFKGCIGDDSISSRQITSSWKFRRKLAAFHEIANATANVDAYRTEALDYNIC